MSLKQDIMAEMKASVKSGDKEKTSILRLIIAAIKNKEIELRHELSDGDVLQVLNTLVKQHNDSIEQYKRASRDDLVAREAYELEIIKTFLPPPLSTEEIEGIVKTVIEETEAEGIGDLGRVMKAVMPRVQGRADGRLVRELVQRCLSSQ